MDLPLLIFFNKSLAIFQRYHLLHNRQYSFVVYFYITVIRVALLYRNSLFILAMCNTPDSPLITYL